MSAIHGTRTKPQQQCLTSFVAQNQKALYYIKISWHSREVATRRIWRVLLLKREQTLGVFCKNCDSLLRPLLWVWSEVWICKNCCAGQATCSHKYLLRRDARTGWGYMNIFKCFPSFRPVRNSGSSWAKCGFYIFYYPDWISIQRQLLSLKTRTFLVPILVTLTKSSVAQLFNVWWTTYFCGFNLISTSFFCIWREND